MKNSSSFYRNSIAAVFVSCMMLATVVVTATENSISMERIENQKEETFNVHLLKRIVNLFDIPSDFKERIREYFGLYDLTKKDLKTLMNEKVIPLHKEVKSIISGKTDCSEMSGELRDLLCIFYECFGGNDETNGVYGNPSEQLNGNGPDFETYWENYQRATSIWLGNSTPENRWPILDLIRLLGISYDNYYDWSTKVTDWLEQLIKISGAIIFLTVFVIAVVPITGIELAIANLLAASFIFIIFYLDLQALAYVNNGHEYMHNLKNLEVNILIHIGYNNSGEFVGINNLYEHYGIEACNLNACENCTGHEAYTTDFFTYYLGPSTYMEEQGENGWYSLRMRYIAEGNKNIQENYKKAPCPPGRWRIIIHGNDEYEGHQPIYLKIDGGETAIIENIELTPR